MRTTWDAVLLEGHGGERLLPRTECQAVQPICAPKLAMKTVHEEELVQESSMNSDKPAN